MTESVVAPEAVIDMVTRELPADLLPHVLLVGSLAAAYHFRESLARGVRTKDADLVIQPAGALDECKHVATRLLTAGWKARPDCYPCATPEPADSLRAIRLYPPSHQLYFVELLGLPNAGQAAFLRWTPLRLEDGWYGVPCFRFFALMEDGQRSTPAGIHYASPAMMALANLLSHPTLGTARMETPIGGQVLLRSAKDLGRVLALAYLAGRDAMEAWADEWARALRSHFPDECRGLAARAGEGLRALLRDPEALDEARHAVDVGLLNGRGVTSENPRALGEQLRRDAIDPLRERFAASVI